MKVKDLGVAKVSTELIAYRFVEDRAKVKVDSALQSVLSGRSFFSDSDTADILSAYSCDPVRLT